MFGGRAFACNFWAGWDSGSRVSLLPAFILGCANPTAEEQRRRVQMELTRHCATWAKFSDGSPPMYRWMLWWKPIKVTRLWWEPSKVTREVRMHERGWETYSESASESDGPEWPEWPVQQHPTGFRGHRDEHDPTPTDLQSRSITPVHTSNHCEVQLPRPADLIKPVMASPSASAPCACGETGCQEYPDCINFLSGLLSQPPAKRMRSE